MNRRWISAGILIILVGLIVLSAITGWLVQWLWMTHLGYAVIFLKILAVKLGLFAAGLALAFFYWLFNLRLLIRNSLTDREEGEEGRHVYTRDGIRLPLRGIRVAAVLFAGIFSLVFALLVGAQWDAFLRFMWGGEVGSADPLYHLDLGFYLFQLPFLELVQNSLTGLTLIGFLVMIMGYFYIGALRMESPRSFLQQNWPVVKHLAGLFLLVLIFWSWGFFLDRYELLFSQRGVVYGAGYTDANLVRIALWITLVASAGLLLLTLLTLYRRRFLILLAGLGAYALLYIVLLFFLPGIVQSFKVKPNELELEAPYLEHNIAFTRKAYQLDRIQERSYPAVSDLTLEQIRENQDTLSNIRLWDWRPIRQTFRQTQEIRLYYQFYEVDVGRYRLDQAGYRQVMLSARELTATLPEKARTWVNKRLQYTHGYGLAMSYVSETAEEGLPKYLIKDLPPVTEQGLHIDRPAIFYGEKMPGYRIVDTKVKEFDYPRGDENVYTHYAGDGGLPVDSLWRRLLFAWEYSDINILLSGYITSGSKIQIFRRLQERVHKVAPFLRLDEDPYLVLSDGKLYWIQDAYTTSSRFPYSEPYEPGMNYIRNSVKVVVDAYHGSVDLYVVDPEDPVLAVYRRAFPGVFTPLDDMTEDLKAHLRYPEGLFTIQAEMFKAYHMTIPQVFYNKEDLWTYPQEKYAGSPIPMEPYYILMRLPGEEKLQYLIMLPLTPEGRDNMIAWIAAKSDFPEYGEVIFYQLPKERLIYGPIQIEAMIDQDDVISQQLSLWDQRGSNVIRGNLLVIPINHSFLYVEPVYLVAQETDIPQLKRVIVVYGKNVVMEPTLDEAIRAAFGITGEVQEQKPAAPAPVSETRLDKIREKMNQAEEALSRGEWDAFGGAMKSLKELLKSPP